MSFSFVRGVTCCFWLSWYCFLETWAVQYCIRPSSCCTSASSLLCSHDPQPGGSQPVFSFAQWGSRILTSESSLGLYSPGSPNGKKAKQWTRQYWHQRGTSWVGESQKRTCCCRQHPEENPQIMISKTQWGFLGHQESTHSVVFSNSFAYPVAYSRILTMS